MRSWCICYDKNILYSKATNGQIDQVWVFSAPEMNVLSHRRHYSLISSCLLPSLQELKSCSLVAYLHDRKPHMKGSNKASLPYKTLAVKLLWQSALLVVKVLWEHFLAHSCLWGNEAPNRRWTDIKVTVDHEKLGQLTQFICRTVSILTHVL